MIDGRDGSIKRVDLGKVQLQEQALVRSQATGWPGRTRSPAWASMPIRKPVKRLGTSVLMPPEEIVPIDCPVMTISPSAVTVSGGKGWKMPAAVATTTRSGTDSCSPAKVALASM